MRKYSWWRGTSGRGGGPPRAHDDAKTDKSIDYHTHTVNVDFHNTMTEALRQSLFGDGQCLANLLQTVSIKASASSTDLEKLRWPRELVESCSLEVDAKLPSFFESCAGALGSVHLDVILLDCLLAIAAKYSCINLDGLYGPRRDNVPVFELGSNDMLASLLFCDPPALP